MHYLRHLACLGASDIHPAGASASRALIDALRPRNGQRLLELGCGTGNTALRLARRADLYVVGVDVLGEMLLAARRRLKNVGDHCAFVSANAAALPFVARSFDHVYCESALGIQSDCDIRRILAETFRVLKPGGMFVANEAIWKPHVDQVTVTAVNRQSELDFGLRPASEHAWAVERWLEEICIAGFQPVSWAKLAAQNRTGIRRIPPVARLMRRLRAMSSPALWRESRLYGRRLALHRANGLLIEARLFVSARPG